MTEVMEVPDRRPTGGQQMPDDAVEEYVNKAFSTPYNISDIQEDDENIGVYEPEDEIQEEVYEPEAEREEEIPVNVPKLEVLVSVPVVEKPTVKQSSCVKNESARYGFPTKVLHIPVWKSLQQYGDKVHSCIMTELQQLVDKKLFASVKAKKLQKDQLKKAIRPSMFLKEMLPLLKVTPWS